MSLNGSTCIDLLSFYVIISSNYSPNGHITSLKSSLMLFDFWLFGLKQQRQQPHATVFSWLEGEELGARGDPLTLRARLCRCVTCYLDVSELPWTGLT